MRRPNAVLLTILAVVAVYSAGLVALVIVLAVEADERAARVRGLERQVGELKQRKPVIVFRFERRPDGSACLLGSATGYRDKRGKLHVKTSPITGGCTP